MAARQRSGWDQATTRRKGSSRREGHTWANRMPPV
jgi:hypothetical protein